MQCRECSASIASNAIFCPICGVRQSTAAVSDPDTMPAAQAAPEVRSQADSLMPQASFGAGRLASQVKGMKPGLPHAGETFANRYRVEKYLGLGALCNSYLCRDLGAENREVVLKVMHARKAAEEGLPGSFLFLAESVAKYDHKGIARIFDTGTHEGAPYYTMEWVGGIPLRLWLMERLNFDNRVLPGLGILRSLLDTFEAIHERGCYGCLKPENVFITLNGPVVMDFGVVGFLSSQEFEFNSYARRYLPYMAPELRQDWGNLLPHSDFFSLGAILYEILVGRAPAPQLRLPSDLSRIFDIESDEIILKSMAAKPTDRFGTVEAFKNAVNSPQASQLNNRPHEKAAGLPPAATATLAPRAHVQIDRTEEIKAMHNPGLAFISSEADGMKGVSGLAPAGKVEDHQTGNPWKREHAPRQAADELDPEADAEGGEDSGSAFARLDGRMVEEAHAQRRFAHPIQSMAGGYEDDGAKVSLNALPQGQAFKDQGTESPADPRLQDEEDAEPVPAWLWVSIALAGSSMVVLSAYFGLLH